MGGVVDGDACTRHRLAKGIDTARIKAVGIGRVACARFIQMHPLHSWPRNENSAELIPIAGLG